ncbi:MAG: protein-L-isoaspartate(D-aspartate) O-methyltransferase [Desulfobacteraceae bacterium]|nr:protein-L-isoaspartate(D-aspartate) O-methyltransferase [Desulfobacteraceae bacterium]
MTTLVVMTCIMISLAPCRIFAGQKDENRFASARAALIKEIEAYVAQTSDYIGAGRLDPAVMQAMATVKRHRFVPKRFIRRAYDNNPLPIGYGQTISQPYIVALMSNLLAAKPGDKILEVGTGSGYQAAVLAQMQVTVYSIEIIRPLAESAKKRLQKLGYDKMRLKTGDGYFGWKEHAPFDGIIVTAAAGHIPPPLLSQLKKGGRMVIPVGGRFSVQQLVVVTKDKNADLSTRQILPVRFVPLTRKK